MTWAFPLLDYKHKLPEPRDDHPGAFGAVRKFDIHTGVDLYCPEGTPIYAVEDGVLVESEVFTGPNAESPWWHETFALLVEGGSGVVVYGEVAHPIKVGMPVKKGHIIGFAKQVLKKDKGKPMCMLHLELMAMGSRETVWWRSGAPQPEGLLDPTEYLLEI